MLRNGRRYLIISLVLIEMISLFLTMKSFSNKEINEIKETYEVDKKHFSMFVSEKDDVYTEYTDSDLFPADYVFDAEKSKCIDTKEQEIEGALSSSNNGVTVTSNKTAYCYLYFEKIPLNDLCSNHNNVNECIKDSNINKKQAIDLWTSTLIDDGYRYYGATTETSDVDNYVCFGYDNAETDCDFSNASNSDKYAYRIVGVFPDANGDYHLKLIKKEALNTAYKWHSDNSSDTAWDNSDLYNGINGSYFLNNTSYSYMQNSTWLNKIVDWTYSAANTNTWEDYGMYYYGSNSSQKIYYNEMGITTSINNCFSYNGSASVAACNIYNERTDITPTTSKIGLMYVSDYMLSLGYDARNYVSYANANVLKTGWIYLLNNDNSPIHYHEWTISRAGEYNDLNNAENADNGKYLTWAITGNSEGAKEGTVSSLATSNIMSVRPVFYLEADTKLDSGTGTSDDPYVIKQPTAADTLIATAGDDLWDSTLEDDGYRFVGTDPDNYICFGTTDTSTCTSDTDKYMYRIIGIFEDTEGQQHLKLIKKESLNTAYAWHSDSSTDTDWDASELYSGINGSYFLTNTTYSYMQDTNWTDKIATWNYTATNTKTYDNAGVNYYYNTVKTTYLHEMNRSGKNNLECWTIEYDSDQKTTTSCLIGDWQTVNSKIGLMYVSDYLLSLGSSALNYTSDVNSSALQTGWMHISTDEWTMSREGNVYGDYSALVVYSYGNVSGGNVDYAYSVRPVFYLTSDVKINGEGTSTSPYLIS